MPFINLATDKTRVTVRKTNYTSYKRLGNDMQYTADKLVKRPNLILQSSLPSGVISSRDMYMYIHANYGNKKRALKLKWVNLNSNKSNTFLLHKFGK